MLAPGADTIAKLGGLHRFMNFDGVMLTDSGGYQIFAMGHGSVSQEIKKKNNHANQKPSLIKITEEGAKFRSYLDGKIFFLTPESSIAIQKKLGADLIVQLDECTPYHVSKGYTQKSMEMSLRWGERSLQEFIKTNDGRQALYRVIQGGIYPDLRKISIEESLKSPFFGTAIGGSLGEDKNQMYDIIATISEQLKDKTAPIHLLGIGDIPDIFWGVRQGIDTFDCVKPTRIARHGCLIVPRSINPQGFSNLKNAQFKNDTTPLNPEINFPSAQYSKGYLHHLLKAKEIAAVEILTEYNIIQMNLLFKAIKKSLQENTFEKLEKYWCG